MERDDLYIQNIWFAPGSNAQQMEGQIKKERKDSYDLFSTPPVKCFSALICHSRLKKGHFSIHQKKKHHMNRPLTTMASFPNSSSSAFIFFFFDVFKNNMYAEFLI